MKQIFSLTTNYASLIHYSGSYSILKRMNSTISTPPIALNRGFINLVVFDYFKLLALYSMMMILLLNSCMKQETVFAV